MRRVREQMTRAHAAHLVLALVVAVAVRLYAFTGTIVSDDLTHAWAATHFWDDPVEHSMPDGEDSGYTVNARRIGVNLPLWAASAVAGPSERTFAMVPLLFSLLGLLAVAAWAGVLAGPRSAVLAAWLWGVLPVDVWHATIWLQDNVYAAILAAAGAALAWGVRSDRRAPWLLAGVALGYLQYVKESAAVLTLALVVLGGVWSWRRRQLHRHTLWLLAGLAIAHLAAIGYFAIVTGDPLHYFVHWISRQVAVEHGALPRAFPANFVRLGFYLTYCLALGLGLPVAAWWGVRWLRRDAAPRMLQVQTALILMVQLAITLHVLRWGAWTMRYLLQVTPVLIAVSAAGLASAWPQVSAARRNALAAALVIATALGVLLGQPQHGHFRGEVARQALAAFARDIPDDIPIYVVASDREAHYTDRAFALLSGYKPRAGGFHLTRAPDDIRRGVLVWASYERHLAPPAAPPGRALFSAQTRGGRDWLVAYAVGF
jgi:hypothetical protein